MIYKVELVTRKTNFCKNVRVSNSKCDVILRNSISELNFVTREFRTSNNPTTDMLNMFKVSVDNEDQFTRKTAIPHDKFLDLVILALKTPWYTFNSKFYQQIDGAKMGAPAS